MKRYRIGAIGFGNIGRQWAAAILECRERWELAYICEIRPDRRQEAQELVPEVRIIDSPEVMYQDPTLDVIGSWANDDSRPDQVRHALAAGKHMIIEKPIAPTSEEGHRLLKELKQSDRLVAVNLFNRNAWYHHKAKAFVDSGQIGKVGVLRVCHMTAGIIPDWGPSADIPPLHTCGMHYVDVARWYANSEYERWHAIGVRMWDEPRPWWGSVHGNFKNGIVFEITNGFIYGQLAKDKSCRCYFECIGTHGFVRFEHDFKTVRLEMHGVDQTVSTEGLYGGKKFDVMLGTMARSIDASRNLGFPTADDAVIAFDIAGRMQADVETGHPARIGSTDDLEAIRQHKTALLSV